MLLRTGVVLASVTILACHGHVGGTPDREPSPTAPLPSGHVPRLESLALRCKLISDRHLDDPSDNDPHGRSNLRGTDLGIPVAHGEDLFFFFGDTAGARGRWPLHVESLPDAVGFSAVGRRAVAADPDVLCSKLDFLRDPATGTFAGTRMTPPPGRSIAEFVHNPSGPIGQGRYPDLPGDFEVPSGALSHGGSIYVFYTIVQPKPLEMKGSYLARWTAPSTRGLPHYDVLHHIDQRFDDRGPLRGDFINIAPLVVGDHLYLYGTGRYRASPVHLARKPLAAIEREGGYQRFDAATRTWVAGAAPGAPVVATPNIGELSVRYFAAIGRYVMLDQEINLGNRIAARFAEAPEGPWSEAVTVATMQEPGFAGRYCCRGTDCAGDGLFECGRAGFYGTYMLPDLRRDPDGSFTISFLMSTWRPYNVALMSATFR